MGDVDEVTSPAVRQMVDELLARLLEQAGTVRAPFRPHTTDRDVLRRLHLLAEAADLHGRGGD